MIKTVTITGADDSIDPSELVKLSREFPFVEWGILVSRKQLGNPRFPSLKWITELYQLRTGLDLSMHLCGSFVKEFLVGNFAFAGEFGDLLYMFRRLQINSNGGPREWHGIHVAAFIYDNPQLEFIFQYDNVNTDLLEYLAKRGDIKNISALYDLSGGHGILPENWPKPLDYCPVGYAGGLGPDNLEAQIRLIEDLVGDTPIWIDMETKVRTVRTSNEGTATLTDYFDLQKVCACLEIAKPFVRS